MGIMFANRSEKKLQQMCGRKDFLGGRKPEKGLDCCQTIVYVCLTINFV
jgi:hypothetical protein